MRIKYLINMPSLARPLLRPPAVFIGVLTAKRLTEFLKKNKYGYTSFSLKQSPKNIEYLPLAPPSALSLPQGGPLPCLWQLRWQEKGGRCLLNLLIIVPLIRQYLLLS